MNILKILVFLLFTSFYKQSEGCSNIYLIRHAEKVRTDKSDPDPDVNRTIKTVKPLAENNSLEIILYSSDEIIYEAFLKSSIGENTLVVGHSNTIPDFVNNLINEDYYDQIDDLNNSNLYIVSLCDSGMTHKLITVD